MSGQVIDMEEARERLESRREQAEHRRLRHKVEQERSEARANGLGWTPYRPFHSPREAVGAVLCASCLGRRSRATARRSLYVSYSTHLDGRTTKCAWCLEGLGVVGDDLSDRMRQVLAYSYDDDGGEAVPVHAATRAALRRRGLVEDPGKMLTENGLAARRILHDESRRRRGA